MNQFLQRKKIANIKNFKQAFLVNLEDIEGPNAQINLGAA